MANTYTIKKREGSPDFVWGSFGCKYEDLKNYVNSRGYINFDILSGKEGGYYAKINDYGINPTPKEDEEADIDMEGVPF